MCTYRTHHSRAIVTGFREAKGRMSDGVDFEVDFVRALVDWGDAVEAFEHGGMHVKKRLLGAVMGYK